MSDVVEKTLAVAPGTWLLTGEEAGRTARAALKLDEADAGDAEVHVRLPAPVVTSEYIRAMVGPSVKRLGLAEFEKRYRFEASRDVRDMIQANAELVANDRF